MTATLETALRTLKLEPGRVYTYHVDDVWVGRSQVSNAIEALQKELGRMI